MEKNIGYIETIVYDEHVAILFIKKSNIKGKERFNVLIDMSRYFANQKVLDSSIFPNEIYNDFIPYPQISIQKHNTCGLWYYGIIECLYFNNFYNTPQEVIRSMNWNKFYIDVINTLSKIIYNNNNIIDERDISKAVDTDLHNNRIFKNIYGYYFSFTKEIIINSFLLFKWYNRIY